MCFSSEEVIDFEGLVYLSFYLEPQWTLYLSLSCLENLFFRHLYAAEVVALLTFQVICKNVYNFH